MSTIAYTFTARFAGVDLEVVEWSENLGRTVIRHEPTRGDGAQLSDRGRVPRSYQLSIRLTGDADTVAGKRDALVAIAESGETRVFEHPLDGVVRCKLESFDGKVAAGDVSYGAALVEDLAFAERFAATTSPNLASIQDIEITGAELLDQLNLLTVTAPVPDIEVAVEKAQTWPDRAQADIFADVTALRADVLELRRELDAATDVDLYQASVALEAFRGSYERYAQAANTIRRATFDLTVGRPVPLIVLLTQVYGASEAEGVADEVARINDVLDASRLTPGTVLALPGR
jgi:hypothetical protein